VDRRNVRRQVRKVKVSAVRAGRQLLYVALFVVVIVLGIGNSFGKELEKEKEQQYKYERKMLEQEIEELKSGQAQASQIVSQSELISKSNIQAEQLNKFLEKTNMKGLGYSFKAAEQEYSVNSVFLTAVAVHESGFGTNTISKKKNNIMSICAYDWSPVSSATSYKTRTDCILRGAELLKKNYLTKGGKYFNGATLEGVNKKYASDKGWAKCVKGYMSQIKGVRL
jgi:beta-N-acetylglucosaminidase